jgi:uncharacterized protein (UPF0248 family)
MKGTLEEIIARARYGDNIKLYTVIYRNMDKYPEVNLDFFINGMSDEYGDDIEIPLHRIQEIRRSGIMVWKKAYPSKGSIRPTKKAKNPRSTFK